MHVICCVNLPWSATARLRKLSLQLLYLSVFSLLLHQLYLAKKTKVERKFIKEEKCRNATAFQVFLTQRNFLYAEYLTARFSWWSNKIQVNYKKGKLNEKKNIECFSLLDNNVGGNL